MTRDFSALKDELKRRASRRRVYRHYGIYAYSVAENTGWNKPDASGARWIESAEGAGLRIVDSADALVDLRHTGWYCDDMQTATYRGYVFQLPSHCGCRRYLCGYAASETDGYRIDLAAGIFAEPEDAAHAADDFSERESEKERDYRKAWQAGGRWADLGEAISSARKTALTLIAEMKRTRPHLRNIRQTLEAKVRQLRTQIVVDRTERAALLNVSARWQFAYGAAFNEGAGAAVFSVSGMSVY